MPRGGPPTLLISTAGKSKHLGDATSRPSPPSDEGPVPKKRARTEGGTEGEDKKRGRGRPRLNVNDETAVERRRTQIRLAQRAYRNRKENAISTLEQQLKAVKQTNEEMSDAFQALKDFAVSRGLLDCAPHLVAQLDAAREKFDSITNISNDSPEGEDDDSTQTGSNKGTGGITRGGMPNGPRSASKSSSPDNLVSHSHAPSLAGGHHQQQPFGGHIVTQEVVTDSGLVTPMQIAVPAIPDLSHTHTLPPHTAHLPTRPEPSKFEVITLPTYENASFPFTFTDAQLQSILGSPSPFPHHAIPSPPTSYASSEITFGRRLQRHALQCGLKLISLPNPPPLRLVRVFGFCLPFETADAIRDRLQASLDRNISESLNWWSYPFHNLGGTGTHLSPGPDTQRRAGNQGTMDILRNDAGTGFGMGPFTRPVAEASAHLDARQRISVPGYEGDFYDAEEVEMYLRKKGVVIPALQDVVEIPVDLTLFEDTNAPDTSAPGPVAVVSTSAQQYPMVEAGLYPGPALMGVPAAPAMGNFGDAMSLPVTTGPPCPPALLMHGNTPIRGWDPALLGPGPGGTGIASGPVPGFVMPETAFQPPVGFPPHEMTHFGAHMSSLSPSPPPKTVVELDVNMFIHKLTETTTCLGRAPGFRLENIHKAFLTSLVSW